jgi:hypothetical protein
VLYELRSQATAMPIRVYEPPAEVHGLSFGSDAAAGDDHSIDLDDVIRSRRIGFISEELSVLFYLVQEDVLGMVGCADRDAGVDVGVSEGSDV